MTDQTEDTEDEWGSLAVSEEDGIEVIKKSYGWTIAVDGSVAGLVAGDQGYDLTHITILREHILALVKDWPEFCHADKDARIEELEAKLAKAVLALEPYGLVARHHAADAPEWGAFDSVSVQLSIRYLRDASTALAELKGTD